MKYLLLKRAAPCLALLFLLGTAGCRKTVPLSEASAALTENSISGDYIETTDDPSGELTVHYMDVGQGDSTLITCEEGAMLIDAGDNSSGTKVQSYLASQNVTHLDYVIGTHPDADHIGGLDVVITKFDCGTILLTGEEKDTNTYEDLLSAMAYKGYQKSLPVPGDTYRLGNASFTIIAPLQENNDSNDNSVALLLTYGKTRFYFEGDAGETEEAQILASNADIAADVYKIGHHGSKTSTTDDMLAAVNPVYAVISAGEDNRYGHPHAEVLNRLRSAKIKTFRTDEQGTVVAKSDGQNVSFNMSPSDTWKAGEPESTSDRDPLPSAKSSGISKNETNFIQSQTLTVHITDTGKKYHAAHCRFLKDSGKEISLEEAKSLGYEPCKVCHPPQ